MQATETVLLEEIAGDFVQYLRSGVIDFTSFTNKINPNLNINEIERLLRIHFVLTTNTDRKYGVIDFVEQLPKRLRRIKTTIKKEKDLFKGEIKGRINWEDTLITRYKHNPEDNTLFVCDVREKDYNIDENLILKKLLQIIHRIVYRDLSVAFNEKYSWLMNWVEEKGLRDLLNSVLFRNAYLRRIAGGEIKVTERMLTRTLNSRIDLYREAAALLQRYRSLMNYDLDSFEAKELLKNTFIRPHKTELLFELYWIIKIIRQFENPKFNLIEPGENVVAEWEYKGSKYRIYHDSIGSFAFKENIKTVLQKLIDKDNYLGRQVKVLEKLEEITDIKSDSLWGGRPDIILEKYNEKNILESVLIGEVKYTSDRNYAIQGLKELLEYIAFIKVKGQYIERYKDLFVNSKFVNGYLFLDKITELNVNLKDESVRIIMFGDDIKQITI